MNEPLTEADYQIQMRDISKAYVHLSESSGLESSWVANEARARLSTLDSTVRPNGPNAPLVRALEDIVGR